MFSHRIGKLPFSKSLVGKTGIVQPDDVMLAAREPIAAQAVLQAEDVDRGRLLPECPLGMHDAWACLLEFNTIDMTRGVATHIPMLAGSPVDRAPELKHVARCDIT